MRRLLTIPLAAVSAVGVLAVPSAALAAPAEVCTVSDPNVTDITGITAVDGGYVVLNKRQNGPLRLYKLDASCKAQRLLNDATIEVASGEDLARTPDGALWVADIGDIDKQRTIIVIDKVTPGATKGIKYRLKYPDGAHNAAAMVVQANGVPVIFTFDAGTAKLYTSAGPLKPGQGPNELQAAGTLTIPESKTDGGTLGPLSRKVVSGAALSPDGKKLVVRTLTDAYEWDIGSDVVTVLKSDKKPRVTPLPNEADGQSIAYTSDGAGYVTASAGSGAKLLEWSAAPLPEPAPAKAANSSGASSGAKDKSFFSSLSLSQLNGLILGAGFAGLLMLIGGIVGMVRFRRKLGNEDEPSLQDRIDGARRANNSGERDHWQDSPAPVAQETVALGPSRESQGAAATTLFAPADQPGRGTVYGGNPAGRKATVYGAPPENHAPDPAPPAGQRGGTVYGGGTYGAPPPPATPQSGQPPRGTTYGSPPQAPPPPQATAFPPRPSQVASPRGGPVYGGPQPPVYGGPQPPIYGGQQGAGNVYGGGAVPPPEPYRPQAAPVGRPQPPSGGGTVYGGRPADPADAAADQRPSRDWRSRRPPE